MSFHIVPIQEIQAELLAAKQVRLFVKREDLLHPLVKGNKWYKLKYNLEEANKQAIRRLLTFGGAFSNHIYATASAGKLFGFETIGIIRGEETLPLNPILAHAQASGMVLHYLDRATYRRKQEEDVLQKLKAKFGNFYLVPEGGTNTWAVKGTKEILQNIDNQYNYVCACGTGGTLAGLAVASNHLDTKILGFSALKGDFLTQDVQQLLESVVANNTIEDVKSVPPNWEICNQYHFGGYAKATTELLSFVNQFNAKYQIPIEPIYTGKMFFGIFDLIQKGYFPPQSTILAIHSGGVY
jgi:1-aminocyclopropane-1-carboxylate deaminase